MAAGLNVWMNGELVGNWRTGRGRVATFQYHETWLQSERVRALSLSLPITAGGREIRGEVVDNFFDNLLPENEKIRARIRTRYGTKSTNALDLLTEIGRDCVGAVQLLPENCAPEGFDEIRSTPLTDQDVEEILLDTTSNTARLGSDERDFRISIAGAQEKTALLRIGNQWHLPRGATPTTHILKLPLGLVGGARQFDMTDSVENEWLCAQIMDAMGFDVAPTEIATFGNQKVLVVERFDRAWGDAGWIVRLPQEDFCQATGTPASAKYEIDGGPGIAACLEVLRAGANADADRASFTLSQLAFWLLGATDGHAKNFSIFHLRGGAYSLTPLYDILSAWPIIGKGQNQLAIQDAKLAMGLRSKNMHYKMQEIQTRHWIALADSCGVPGMRQKMITLVENVNAALDDVWSRLPNRFPGQLWDRVRAGMQKQAILFARGLRDA